MSTITPASLDRAALLARFWRPRPPAPPVDLIGTTEMAARLGMSPDTVRVWLRNGKLPVPVHPVGTWMRVLRPDFEAYLAGQAAA